jgi:head-tail adaptor
MRAGRNRHRLLLQRRGPQVTDAEGNTPDNWQPVMWVWVEITAPSVLAQAAGASEREVAEQPEQRRPHVLSMRGNLRGVVDHNCRFLLGGDTVPPARVLEVLTVQDRGELHTDLSVQCMEIIRPFAEA